MLVTTKELAVLDAIVHSHYGDMEHPVSQQVWNWAVTEDQTSKPSGLSPHAIAGVLSSLQKKGLVDIEDYDEDGTVAITQEEYDILVAS